MRKPGTKTKEIWKDNNSPGVHRDNKKTIYQRDIYK